MYILIFIIFRSTPIPGFLDDYAFVIKGLLDLYESDLNEEWLEFAEKLQHLQDQYFWDEKNGGYFSTTSSDPSIILRLKEGIFKYFQDNLSLAIKAFMVLYDTSDSCDCVQL